MHMQKSCRSILAPHLGRQGSSGCGLVPTSEIFHLLIFAWGVSNTWKPYRKPILADDRVRYVGEPVAVVFATDAYLAEDAAELVAMEVEELPARVDADAQSHAFDVRQTTAVPSVRKEYGDVEAAFATAHFIVALDLSIGRHSGVPLETRGAIAHFDAMLGTLTLYGAAKVPHANRDALARMLGREPISIRLREGHVGGGFGVRGELYPEDILVCLAALRLGRPIKWIEDRREHLIAANHSRQERFAFALRSTKWVTFWLSTVSFGTTRVLTYAHTGQRCLTFVPPCCRVRTV